MSDYELIVSSAVRYALGRRTYIVSVVCNYIKSHLDELSEPCRRSIKRDIQGAYSLGDECDERDWKELERILQEMEFNCDNCAHYDSVYGLCCKRQFLKVYADMWCPDWEVKF